MNEIPNSELKSRLEEIERKYEEALQTLKECKEDLNKLRKKGDEQDSASSEKPSKHGLADLLLKSQPGLFVLIDKQYVIHWWNERLEYYSGRSSDEVEGSGFLEYVMEDDRDAIQNKLEEAFNNNGTDIEVRLISKEKGSIPFLITCVKVEMEDQPFLITTGLDITEKEQERIQKLRYFRVLENSSNEIFLFKENTLKLVYVNEGARKNLGYSQKELQNMSATELQTGFDDESFREHIRPLIDHDQKKLSYITELIRSDKSTYKVEIHLHLIEQDDDRFLVSIALDITDRLENEEKIKASLKEKEILLREIHHRVKNNLAIVSSLINMQARKVEEGYVRTQLRESESRIKSMAMIHQMLYEEDDFSKISFDVYVRKMIDRIAINFNDSGAEVDTEIQGNNMHIDVSEAVPCALIINEVITNAYKHAFVGRDKGKVQVSLTVEDDKKIIRIKDNGIGLPDHIDGKEVNSIGLSLMRGLTNQIGGSLDIKSNGGTSITVKF
ncbi:MAG: histidine kinase dimerization/phosphoacceptor domain -containing protein [Balneolales bacterium]